jgi:hypothetical protein
VPSAFATLAQWWRYLLGKRGELAALDYKDAVLAKAVLDIHRLRSDKRVVCVPLQQLFPVHRLDRDSALATLRERAAALRAHRQELLASRLLDTAALVRVIPSVSAIKVVRESPQRYLAYEGNGRLYAMREVFSADDGMQVEVEEYLFARPEKVLRRLRRVRRLNRLED